MSRVTTVSSPGWSVSCITGTNIPGAVLSVKKPIAGRFGTATDLAWFRSGDHDGRLFPGYDEAREFLIERGYSVPYHSADSVFRAVHRASLRAVHRGGMAGLREAKSRRDVLEVAEVVRKAVLLLAPTGWGLGSRWFNGVFSAARRLRPELFAGESRS